MKLDADPPFEIVRDCEFRVQLLSLQPGDRVFFLTDGIFERNAAGLDIHALVKSSADEHPRTPGPALQAFAERPRDGVAGRTDAELGL